jgi:hypothetical protein
LQLATRNQVLWFFFCLKPSPAETVAGFLQHWKMRWLRPSAARLSPFFACTIAYIMACLVLAASKPCVPVHDTGWALGVSVARFPVADLSPSADSLPLYSRKEKNKFVCEMELASDGVLFVVKAEFPDNQQLLNVFDLKLVSMQSVSSRSE